MLRFAMLHHVMVQKLIRSPMLYPAELRARASFQWVSRTPNFLGTAWAPKRTPKNISRPRLSELTGEGYGGDAVFHRMNSCSGRIAGSCKVCSPLRTNTIGIC